MRELTFEFSQKGLQEALQDHEFKAIDDFIEDLKKTPRVVPMVLVGLLAVAGLYTFGGSAVAYKAIEDISLVAFKYIK